MKIPPVLTYYRSFQPTFTSVYQKFCKNKNIEPEIITTKSGLHGAWVGDKKTAKYIIIYYHGEYDAYPLMAANMSSIRRRIRLGW
jgi:hypothetical protein